MVAATLLSAAPWRRAVPSPKFSHAQPSRAGVADASRAFVYDANSAPALWTPHRPVRPEKHEGGRRFKLVSDYSAAGDQPEAIRELTEGINARDHEQVLLGVTGSGKTFTMARIIEETQRPALILAHNKTLAAQLIPSSSRSSPRTRSSTSSATTTTTSPRPTSRAPTPTSRRTYRLNQQIDRMRHSATRAILERDDVIVVASVSCIYGIGSVETYSAMTFEQDELSRSRRRSEHRRRSWPSRSPPSRCRRCRDQGDHDHVVALQGRPRRRVAHPVDLLVQRCCPSRCRCRCGDVGLGLVVVVVGDEVLDRVLGKNDLNSE